MSGDYHGWDEDGDNWTFASVKGEMSRDKTFVITDFGGCKMREALSAIMCATKQFQGRIHLRRSTESNKRMIDQLVEAKVVRIAPVTGTEHEEVGVLGVRSKPPQPPKPWWKFW